MKCPTCNGIENKVTDSRLSKEGSAIRRRRACLGCDFRFTTYERIEENLPMLIKKDGRREELDRKKILSGVKKACEKRPISVSRQEELVDKVIKEIQDSGEKEISGTRVGEGVMKELQSLDEVAYVRFASVYRSFKDIGEFMDEMKDLLRIRKTEG
ncbi:MAG: transcriptional regulator NrdR [Nitrospinota bacterium]